MILERTKPADNKQLGRKNSRFLHIKSRFCILLPFILTTVVLVTLLNSRLQLQRQSLHKYVRGIINAREGTFNPKHENYDDYDLPENNDDFDLIWNDDSVAMFQEHLGIVVDEDSKVEQCDLDERQVVVMSLPGPNNEDLHEAVWQFLSLYALEAQTLRVDDYGREYTLKAFVTEQMKIMSEQLFEG